jgi:hypothetical protein
MVGVRYLQRVPWIRISHIFLPPATEPLLCNLQDEGAFNFQKNIPAEIGIFFHPPKLSLRRSFQERIWGLGIALTQKTDDLGALMYVSAFKWIRALGSSKKVLRTVQVTQCVKDFNPVLTSLVWLQNEIWQCVKDFYPVLTSLVWLQNEIWSITYKIENIYFLLVLRNWSTDIVDLINEVSQWLLTSVL